MAYTLKTTGIAAAATSIIAVDDDGTTIRDFKSATRTANMTVNANVSRGSSTWKGGSRFYFETKANGSFDFYGLTFASGHEIPFNNSTGAPGTGTFIAYAGTPGISGGGTAAMLANAAGSDLLNRFTGTLNFGYSGTGTDKGLTTLPTDNTTKFSVGANFLYGSNRDYFYGLESGSLAADGAYSEGGFGANSLISAIGGAAGQGNAPGKTHVIIVLPRPLTLSEYQSLHNDWFGTLFEVATNAVPTFPGPNIANITATQNVAITPDTVSDSFSDTDALTFSTIGSWPAGITVTSAGVIQGTPTVSGTFAALQVRATDTAAQSVDSNTFTITIAAAPAAVNLVGSNSSQAATSGTGAISTMVGTLISSPMKSFFTGLLKSNETGIDIFVYDKTGGDTGALAVKLTGQANNVSGIWSGTNALFVTGQAYRLIYKFADGSEGMETRTAT
jgi:hypothetical protein